MDVGGRGGLLIPVQSRLLDFGSEEVLKTFRNILDLLLQLREKSAFHRVISVI